MPIRTLSKDAEDQLIAAVKQAVALVDEQGLSPDDAIEKVARDQKWGRDMVRFAGHAYNTGRQTAQREQADSALGKFATFPLVDPEAVIDRLWPAQVKAANDAAYATAVSGEYSAPPAWLALQAADAAARRCRSLREKAAADGPRGSAGPEGPGHPGYDAAGKTAMAAAYNRYRQLKSAAEEARFASGTAYNQLLVAMGTLGDYFRKAAHDRLAFAVVRRLAQIKHGAAADTLFTYVAERNRQHRVEAVEPVTKFARLIEYDPARAPWNLVERCLTLATGVKEKRAAHQAAVDGLDAFVRTTLAPYVAPQRTEKQGSALIPQEDRRFFRDEDLRPFLPARQAPPKQAAALTPSPAAGPWTLLDGTKAAGFDLSGTKDMLDKALGGDADSAVQKTWMDLEDPRHDAQLRQIRTQVLMADLMNDDVIGSYAPHHVAKAYNEISQMAPRTAGQPVAVRTLLRRHLQGHMEPFEAKEIADIEGKLKDTENETPNTRILREAPQNILG